MFLTDGEITTLLGKVVSTDKILIKAQLKKVAGELDIEFIINMLKQAQSFIWQKEGQDICRNQIARLRTLLKGVE